MISLFIQCPSKQNFLFRIKSDKENQVLKDFNFIHIFAPFTTIFMPDGSKTSHTLQQTCKFPLQVCLGMYVLLLPPGMKGL